MAKIGIALSGGGIKGLCHAGALKALEESGIRPDILSGVSAGAIVGSLYADGYSPDEIADIAAKEHVDAVGVSLLSGAHNTLMPKVINFRS